MRYMRAMLLGAALAGAAASVAAAQNLVPVQFYQDRDDREAFREGYRQGQWDAHHGRRPDAEANRWREGNDRRSYREGYFRGYREIEAGVRYDGDRYREGYADSPRRFGYQDGYNDGLNDRRTGHSFRPTHDDNYRHADRGYSPGFGNKNYYKQIYREGYEQGYRQGYDSGWRH
jgi:opacity protein-like surface antigen